jgi:hypothetical protein
VVAHASCRTQPTVSTVSALDPVFAAIPAGDLPSSIILRTGRASRQVDRVGRSRRPRCSRHPGRLPITAGALAVSQAAAALLRHVSRSDDRRGSSIAGRVLWRLRRWTMIPASGGRQPLRPSHRGTRRPFTRVRPAGTSSKLMKQVLQDRNGLTVVRDVPPPPCLPGSVLVRNAYSVISSRTERSRVELAQKSLLGKARERPDLVREVIVRARREGIRTTPDAIRRRLADETPVGYSSPSATSASSTAPSTGPSPASTRSSSASGRRSTSTRPISSTTAPPAPGRGDEDLRSHCGLAPALLLPRRDRRVAARGAEKRPGPCLEGRQALLAECLRRLPDGVPVLLRADEGFFGQGFLAELESKAVTYAVGAPLIASLKQRIELAPFPLTPTSRLLLLSLWYQSLLLVGLGNASRTRRG